MKLTGAQIVWECLALEGIDVVFGYPGGTVVDLYDALYDSKVRHVLVRHEQAAAHAADGYARATGKVGVCVATSGPGATNLVTGLATAALDSSPVLAITGQVFQHLLGKDAFQEMDITGITLPLAKHNFFVTDVRDLAQAMKEALTIARTGRPGPVLVDIPRDVQRATAEFVYPDQVDLPGLKKPRRAAADQLSEAARMINAAEMPLILAGRGVTLACGQPELLALAEKAHLPVVTTLLGKSCVPETHPLCLGMGGMHGEVYANRALQAADVILAVGMRFDDRLTGMISAFAPRARIIHIDIDRSEIGKNVAVELAIVADAKEALTHLLPQVVEASRETWMQTISSWREDSAGRDILNREKDRLVPQYVIRTLWEATRNRPPIMVSDVGQHQMWEAQYFYHERPRGLLSSGGLGTMGFGLPAAIGAQVGCPDDPVWVVVGDGGIQMNIQELGTIKQEGLPIKIALINNGYLGMVAQWQRLFYNKRYSATKLVNPDFLKLAEAYDIPGFMVTRREEVRSAIDQAVAHPGPVLIEFVVEPEENVYPMVSAGSALDNMILRPDPEDL